MFRTWADVLHGTVAGGNGAGTFAALAASTGALPPRAAPVDRKAREGPPACCRRRFVAADMLVWYGGLDAEPLARVRAALPHLKSVADKDLYLCDGCRSKLRRAGALAPEEMPRSRPLAEKGAG